MKNYERSAIVDLKINTTAHVENENLHEHKNDPPGKTLFRLRRTRTRGST